MTARDVALSSLQAAGMNGDTARACLRYAATLRRLAYAKTDGDYPASKDAARECPKCTQRWDSASFKQDRCPECRTLALVFASGIPAGWLVSHNDDPRGPALAFVTPTGQTIRA